MDSRHHEQDLAGFPEVEHSRGSAISHVAEATKDEADVPASLVHSPSKFAARGHMGEGQAIGTSVHPSTQDMQIVSSCVSLLMLGYDCIKQDCFATSLVTRQCMPKYADVCTLQCACKSVYSLQAAFHLVSQQVVALWHSVDLLFIWVQSFS